MLGMPNKKENIVYINTQILEFFDPFGGQTIYK